jgi:hypothetical protein
MDGRGTAASDASRRHDLPRLRHAAISIWIAMGADDLQVAKWAGHRGVSFTKDRCGNPVVGHVDLVIRRMEALIAEAETQRVA